MSLCSLTDLYSLRFVKVRSLLVDRVHLLLDRSAGSLLLGLFQEDALTLSFAVLLDKASVGFLSALRLCAELERQTHRIPWERRTSLTTLSPMAATARNSKLNRIATSQKIKGENTISA